jgi:diaminopimelate epimerase
MSLIKYCALGNDYWVVQPQDKCDLSPMEVRYLCNRRYGLGGAGVLYGPTPLGPSTYGCKIFNADGSLAETSGNGLSIFARHLADEWLHGDDVYCTLVPSAGCRVDCHVKAQQVEVNLGQAKLSQQRYYAVPREFRDRFHLPEQLTLWEVNLGNPHCVVPLENPSEALAKSLGVVLEGHPWFPQRTNVQFVEFNLPGREMRLEIWERGCGYTWGSGSSACAAAFVHGQVYGPTNYTVAVKMPGGTLAVSCREGHCRFFNRAHRVAEIPAFNLAFADFPPADPAG